MNIIVNCGCGSTYNFDEEPVNGHLRFPVACTNCGTDGTSLANEYIRKAASGELAWEREQAERRGKVWWRRLFSRRSPNPAAVETGEQSGAGKIRLGLGVIGACVGGIIGMAIWYGIGRWTGLSIGFVAIGVGALAGLGARLAVPEGSFGLAGIASLVAFTAILGGQYLGLRDVVEIQIKNVADYSYNGMVNYAAQAEKAETDKEITRLLAARHYSPRDAAAGENLLLCPKRQLPLLGMALGSVMEKGSAPSLKQVIEESLEKPEFTAADIALFRQTEQPQARAFLKGQPSKAEFDNTIGGMIREHLSLNNMITQSWTPKLFLFLVLGVCAAYRIAYNRSETESI
jgi:hypothetical protein